MQSRDNFSNVTQFLQSTSTSRNQQIIPTFFLGKKETIICLEIYEHSNFLNGKNLFCLKIYWQFFL